MEILKMAVRGQNRAAWPVPKSVRVYPSQPSAATERASSKADEMAVEALCRPVAGSSGGQTRLPASLALGSGQPAGADRRQWLGRRGARQEHAGAAIQSEDLAGEILAAFVHRAVEGGRKIDARLE